MALRSLRSVVQLRPIERDPVVRRLARCADVDDLRREAKRQLPAGVFDYIDGGAEGERTLDWNARAYRDLELHANVLNDVSRIDTTTTLLGRQIAAPVVLAPTGFTRVAHTDGELAVARAAGRVGLPYALSTMGTTAIEDLAAVATAPLWFQVYVWKDRGLVTELIKRAAAAGYTAITVTVDTAVLGRRERDVRRGFTMPPKLGLDTLLSGVVRPRWSWQLLRNPPITFANLLGRSGLDGSTAIELSSFVANEFDAGLSWQSLEWIRAASDLPIVLKGIQRADDARRAVSLGIEAIAVSNHGGRQLDGAPATVTVLPRVVDAVGGEIEVICDGGVRRGGDIVKACALGANAVMLARPYMYGLAAGGERGVDHVLGQLLGGLRRTMALVGRTRIADLTEDLLRAT